MCTCKKSQICVFVLYLKEKGRDLAQSYDKSPYTSRNVKGAKWQHKQRHKKVRFKRQKLFVKHLYPGALLLTTFPFPFLNVGCLDNRVIIYTSTLLLGCNPCESITRHMARPTNSTTVLVKISNYPLLILHKTNIHKDYNITFCDKGSI